MYKPIGITMGDPAGIGPELVSKLLLTDQKNVLIYANFECLKKFAPTVNLNDSRLVNVIGDFDTPNLVSGKPSAEGGHISLTILRRAVDDCIDAKLSAIITGPISKFSWHLAGQNWPGHTELLANLANPKNPPKVRMLLYSQNLMIVLNSVHISLKDAILNLNESNLIETVQITDRWYSKNFGKKAQIILAALNPHAGESGILGYEEIEILKPVVLKATECGIRISGPYPADTVFFKNKNNDSIEPDKIIVALYHDQGLIPFKLNGLDAGINTTIGLPFLRTSVDHGTAFDIAGKNLASLEPMLVALSMTKKILSNRR
ncbi:4-hydroxythreonine-4-phosphate dehydrogenase PdxA [Betaproteobacteria bacterium]|nr:4-hydroxythreonine-4-phosphate dehydrogenase PdxA [Betaproteobacteria bacterium]